MKVDLGLVKELERRQAKNSWSFYFRLTFIVVLVSPLMNDFKGYSRMTFLRPPNVLCSIKTT